MIPYAIGKGAKNCQFHLFDLPEAKSLEPCIMPAYKTISAPSHDGSKIEHASFCDEHFIIMRKAMSEPRP